MSIRRVVVALCSLWLLTAPLLAFQPPSPQQQINAQPAQSPATTQPLQNAPSTAANSTASQQQADDKKKKGFWGKLTGVFKDEGDQQQQQQPQPQPPKPH